MWKRTFRKATFYADLSKLCVAKNYGLAEVLYSVHAGHWILRLSDKNTEISLADLHIQSSLFLLLETTVKLFGFSSSFRAHLFS
jgi:hypothetical protein